MNLSNEVLVPEDSHFTTFVQLCDVHDGWDVAYSRKAMKVWTKNIPGSSFKMIKARAEFSNVSAETVYDVLHDPEYRLEWDKYVLDSKDLGCLNANNDLCYHCVSCPKPFRNRDFVLQRSWLDRPNEKIIFNHSVCHDDYPPVKTIVRATSHVTGYLVRPHGKDSAQLSYLTHSDPKGSLPAWMINKLTKVITPKMIKKVYASCIKYPSWKAQNKPHWKPWIFPEQLTPTRADVTKCAPRQYEDQEMLDESLIKEETSTFLVVEQDQRSADSDGGDSMLGLQNGSASPRL